MSLGAVLGRYKNELICDLAEYYGIYDYRAVPVDTLAALTAGLSPGSRVGMKLTGLKVPPTTLYLAHILDDFNLLLWSFSKNASSSNRPKSIAEDLIEKPPKKNDIESFKSGADFERRRAELVKRITEQKKAKGRSQA